MPTADPPRPPVPLTILTGFLGAGKTTMLNRILNGDHGLRVAVLVNDFGTINIDAELVVGVENDVMSLANGCVCCSIRDDLRETVLETINRPEAPEYILLEASGVADPGGISMTFVEPALRDRVRLDSVTCVVDTEQVFAHRDYPALELLKLKQIGFADMLVLNKVTLAGSEQVQRVRQWIDEQFNRVRIMEADHCNVPLEVLMSVGRFDVSQLQRTVPASAASANAACNNLEDKSDHRDAFSTWTYKSGKPLDLDLLRSMIKKQLPASVYRCKGFVHSQQFPDRRSIVQCVGRRTDVSEGDQWGKREKMTRIVAIGTPGAIEQDVLQNLFDSCHAVTQASQ